MPAVRTRFAPSPTGYLHIGGARTALFNYLFARHHGGTFILRIEDTDRERSTEEAIEAILQGLTWLQLDWDEGPYRQTERLAIYRDKAEWLLQQGKAYPCVCAPEVLETKRKEALKAKLKPKYDGTCRPKDRSDAERIAAALRSSSTPFTVRFMAPKDGTTIVEDKVKGPVVFVNNELDDLILVRSDGAPTYNFCVVVDDIDMEITHVIRGDDHLANTPRQILLYQAMEHPTPEFAHVPLILGVDKARLSKRHGATSVMAYRDMGYLPEALVNYLVRLGWSHGDQEIFSRAELIEKFTLGEVGKAAGVFNPEKLLWLNAHYLKARSLSQLAEEATPFIAAKGYAVPQDKHWLEEMIATLRERAKTLVDLVDMAHYYLSDEMRWDDKAVKKFLTPAVRGPMEKVLRGLAEIEDFNVAAIEPVFTRILAEEGLSLGNLAQPVRVALTGSTVSPGIYEVIAVLGKERTVRRLQQALEKITAP